MLAAGCSHAEQPGPRASASTPAPETTGKAGSPAGAVLTGIGAPYRGVPGDEHYPYPKLGNYNVIADVGGLVSTLDRQYNPGVPEAVALASIKREVLPADAELLTEKTLPQCKMLIYTSATLAAAARYTSGSGGFAGASVTLVTGGIDSNDSYNPSSVGYLTVLGAGPESLTPNDRC